MSKPKKVIYILGILVISILSLSGGKGKAQVSDPSVQYIKPKPCNENGYATWDGAFWHADGKDCWCNDRENVVDKCA